ncbi:hypothetical protein SLEP1_g41249 [Rubroshorea leprosula]|uniref:Uncharacterized protein n=1 Tax=Rubroshorea leprosula TaxID=152421 RepID=A0AAV5L696_9ROSI|nr:hypothetical protein SLEP1_g41249 [Rubroshorea leprosula]
MVSVAKASAMLLQHQNGGNNKPACWRFAAAHPRKPISTSMGLISFFTSHVASDLKRYSYWLA